MTLIEKPGNWLAKALGLRPGIVPADLDERGVIPIVDAYQDGAGAGTWSFVRHDVTNPASATDYAIVAATADKVSIVTANVGRVGGAGAPLTDVYAFLRPDPYSVAAQLRLWSVAAATVPAAVEYPWSTIGAGQRFWFVPPQMRLSFRLPAGDGATDRYIVNAAVFTAPLGFKLW